MGGCGLTGSSSYPWQEFSTGSRGDYIELISMPSSPWVTSKFKFHFCHLVVHEHQVGNSGTCCLHWCYTCLSPENCSPLPEHT